MGRLAKALSEDIGAASLRLRLNRALQTLHEAHPSRKRELHVSDFTDNDKAWCYRALMMRYYFRKDELRNTTWVQYDGKFREEKWRRLLEAEGMMLDYQKALKLGPLSGHPDFIVRLTPKGTTLHVVELTGHDKSIDYKLLAIRTAKKKRQARCYMMMLYWEVLNALAQGKTSDEIISSQAHKSYPKELAQDIESQQDEMEEESAQVSAPASESSGASGIESGLEANARLARRLVGTGYVIVEDKGSCEFKILPVPWDEKEFRPLLERVARAKALIGKLDKVEEADLLAAIRQVEGCGRQRCSACNPKGEE